jgi:hypothetical protein
MIPRLLRGATSLAIFFCLATVVAQAFLFVYLTLVWKPDRNQAIQALAILQGVDLFAMKEKAEQEGSELSVEQVSYDQIRETRAIKVYHLELREQALQDALSQLAFEQRKLSEERKRYKQLRDEFDQQLLQIQEGAIVAGTDNVQTKLEGIKPKQAKDLLLQMLKNDKLDQVVELLANMPTVKCAKIMGEFKTAEESKQLYEILQRIRDGYPNFDLAATTQEKLQQPGPTAP